MFNRKEFEFINDKEIILAGNTYHLVDLGFATNKLPKD